MKASGATVGVSRHSGGIGGAKTGRIPPIGGHDGDAMIIKVGTPVGEEIGDKVGDADTGARVGLGVGLAQHASLQPILRSLPSIGHLVTQPDGFEDPSRGQNVLHPRGNGALPSLPS